MREITWQNVLAPGPAAATIAYFGAGGLSHSDVLGPDGWLWGARSDRIRDYTQRDAPLIPAGFQRRPPNYARWSRRIQYTLRVTDREHARFWRFTEAQVGKPYDPYAILCFALPPLARHRNWRQESAWFCSEEQPRAAEVAGIIPSLDESYHWVTPGGWGLILCGAGARLQRMPLVWPARYPEAPEGAPA